MSRYTFLASLFAVAYLSAAAAAFINDAVIHPQTDAICESDSDCLKHCPPPADDPDCDGGPADEFHNRGDYGSQP